jgi:hypothetical protein
MTQEFICWSALWRSENKLDGKREHLLFENYFPVMFRTRKQAREYINARYGYIKERKDLQQEPHGWKMPTPVRIKVVTK